MSLINFHGKTWLAIEQEGLHKIRIFADHNAPILPGAGDAGISCSQMFQPFNVRKPRMQGLP